MRSFLVYANQLSRTSRGSSSSSSSDDDISMLIFKCAYSRYKARTNERTNERVVLVAANWQCIWLLDFNEATSTPSKGIDRKTNLFSHYRTFLFPAIYLVATTASAVLVWLLLLLLLLLFVATRTMQTTCI